MPTVLRVGAYRLYFYSHETGEPPHVHIDRDRYSAKYWLQPVRLAGNAGFSPRELRELHRLVTENGERLMEAWNGFFGHKDG